MEVLQTLFIIIEALICVMLIGIILMQRSKSEGLGLAFGAGAGESLFGARAGNVLTKITIGLGVAFLANTLFLGVLFAKGKASLLDADELAGGASVPAAQATIDPSAPVTDANALDISPDEIVVPEVTPVEVPAVDVSAEIPATEEMPKPEDMNTEM